MCGIAGIVNLNSGEPVDVSLIDRMTSSMSHRGPDDDGLYVNGCVALGHRRLSIIDLESGHQPMVCKTRGRVIVFNGEIYNFQELRERLQQRGLPFLTRSDTEVLLQLCDSEDLSWLERLNGMFAFAFWDEKQRTLLLARDRLGIKPLYYAMLKGTLVFASEIKALCVHPGLERVVNEPRIPEYLAFRSLTGDETLLKGVYQVPPGCAMVWREGMTSPVVLPFWREGEGRTAADYADRTEPSYRQLEELLVSSVRYRMISDVPLGTFNSGGVDSSLVTAIVRSMFEGELHTFSVGFEEPSYDERRYAQMVADKLGTRHHTLTLSEYDYADALEETLWHLEEPIHHPHTVQLLSLSKLAKQFVTVVLTGEGSDELFAGYPRYQIPRFLRYCPSLSDELAERLIRWATKVGARRAVKCLEYVSLNQDEDVGIVHNARPVPLGDYRNCVSSALDLRARRVALRNGSARFLSPLSRTLYLDQRAYLPSLLLRLDKMSMAAGIEARVPFLDYRIVEWSYLLPDNAKVRGFTTKWVVKRLAEKWLPGEIVHRKKVGFGVPLGKWLRNRQGVGRYLSLLEEKKTVERGYFDASAVRLLVRDHLSGVADHSEVMWGLVNLELWLRMFVDRDASRTKCSDRMLVSRSVGTS
ncbi:MAG: asparagine synthase (glutamine-hydrolyzing) [Nitrospiraceae bacterium]